MCIETTLAEMKCIYYIVYTDGIVFYFILLPIELRGETGVWKKRMDDVITTTRFTQFPTECVTGDTISNIMYDT